jgi:hypothetical protein
LNLKEFPKQLLHLPNDDGLMRTNPSRAHFSFAAEHASSLLAAKSTVEALTTAPQTLPPSPETPRVRPFWQDTPFPIFDIAELNDKTHLPQLGKEMHETILEQGAFLISGCDQTLWEKTRALFSQSAAEFAALNTELKTLKSHKPNAQGLPLSLSLLPASQDAVGSRRSGLMSRSSKDLPFSDEAQKILAKYPTAITECLETFEDLEVQTRELWSTLIQTIQSAPEGRDVLKLFPRSPQRFNLYRHDEVPKHLNASRLGTHKDPYAVLTVLWPSDQTGFEIRIEHEAKMRDLFTPGYVIVMGSGGYPFPRWHSGKLRLSGTDHRVRADAGAPARHSAVLEY